MKCCKIALYYMLGDLLNENQPTDSAEEAIKDSFKAAFCGKVLAQSPPWL
jgi:predicted HD phosphohydrolase